MDQNPNIAPLVSKLKQFLEERLPDAVGHTNRQNTMDNYIRQKVPNRLHTLNKIAHNLRKDAAIERDVPSEDEIALCLSACVQLSDALGTLQKEYNPDTRNIELLKNADHLLEGYLSLEERISELQQQFATDEQKTYLQKQLQHRKEEFSTFAKSLHRCFGNTIGIFSEQAIDKGPPQPSVTTLDAIVTPLTSRTGLKELITSASFLSFPDHEIEENQIAWTEYLLENIPANLKALKKAAETSNWERKTEYIAKIKNTLQSYQEWIDAMNKIASGVAEPQDFGFFANWEQQIDKYSHAVSVIGKKCNELPEYKEQPIDIAQELQIANSFKQSFRQHFKLYLNSPTLQTGRA